MFKKISLIIIFFIVLFTGVRGAFAILGPAVPKVQASGTPSSTTSTSGTTTSGTSKKGSVKNNPQGFLKQFNILYQVHKAISTAGPQIAQNLANVSGQLFDYLAVISLVVWAIQNLLFGDKGIKEFMIFSLFLAFARGLLAAYNFFFVDGVANFFANLGQIAVGSNGSPMGEFGRVFQQVYIDIGNIMSGGQGGIWGFIFTVKSAISGVGITVILDQILLLIIAAVIFGTIILVQVYIALALITGYIFVPFMIFKPLEFLWNGWLKFLIVSCLSWFLIYVVIGLMGSVLNAIAESAGYSGNAVDKAFGTLMAITVSPANPAAVDGFLFMLAIFAYLILKIPAIAGEIVSGMPNISVSGVTAIITGVASAAMTVGTAGAGGVASAAKTATQVAKTAGKAAKSSGGDKK